VDDGAVTVTVGPQTYYNINGVTFVGAAGLGVMSGAPISTPIAVYGQLSSLSGITPTFTATTVLVGTSLEDPLQDHIVGVVSARTGDVLTVIHAQYLVSAYGNADFLAGSTSYLLSASVTVGSATTVFEAGATGSLSPQSISVGQAVEFGGIGTVDATATTLTLDATAGQARLINTRAWGILSTPAAPNSLSLDLLTLDGIDQTAFNFSGVGGGVVASSYPVNTGSIDESATPTGTLLAVDGTVTPFGAAPPALNASAITAGAASEQEVVVEWNGDYVANPFSAINDSGLVVDLKNPDLASWHFIYTGPTAIDLTQLPESPLITTAGADPSQILLSLGTTELVTGISSGMSVYSNPVTYIQTLYKSLMSSTDIIYRLVAFGQYNSASNTFVATRINVAFKEAAPAT
jgi:hypothetical protein